LNVKARAEAVGTYRRVNVLLMEMLASWVPSTPEMEVKVLFGRHLWLVAQLADRLGLRARELRATLHFERAPAAAFGDALAAAADLEPTTARLDAFYDVVLPSVEKAYRDYLARTDALIDEPTVVVLQDALRDIERMRRESAQLFDEFPALRPAAAPSAGIRARFAASGMVQASPESATA
jgi:hypothetical protein